MTAHKDDSLSRAIKQELARVNHVLSRGIPVDVSVMSDHEKWVASIGQGPEFHGVENKIVTPSILSGPLAELHRLAALVSVKMVDKRALSRSAANLKVNPKDLDWAIQTSAVSVIENYRHRWSAYPTDSPSKQAMEHIRELRREFLAEESAREDFPSAAHVVFSGTSETSYPLIPIQNVLTLSALLTELSFQVHEDHTKLPDAVREGFKIAAMLTSAVSTQTASGLHSALMKPLRRNFTQGKSFVWPEHDKLMAKTIPFLYQLGYEALCSSHVLQSDVPIEAASGFAFTSKAYHKDVAVYTFWNTILTAQEVVHLHQDGALGTHDYDRAVVLVKRLSDKIEEAQNLTKSITESERASKALGEIVSEGMEKGFKHDSEARNKRLMGEKPPIIPRASTWGKMDVVEPPRHRARSLIRLGRTKRRVNMGGVISNITRWTTDKKVFKLSKHSQRATFLFDMSGSMRVDTDTIDQIVGLIPEALVAGYSGGVRSGELVIIAKSGSIIHQDDLNKHRHGGNVVDGPALRWLAKQTGPRIWVSDGHVTGVADSSSDITLRAEAFSLVKAHDIIRVDNYAMLKQILTSAVPSRELRRA